MTSSKLSLREMAILSLLGTLLYIMQVVMAVLPNIELVSLLIILYARVYGWKAFYPIYLFVALEGLTYGISDWFLSYLYVWAILAIVSLIFRKVESHAFWIIVCTAFGLCFGFLCAFVQLCMGGLPMMIARWIEGIPFDLLHVVGNFLTSLLLYKPLYLLLSTLKQRYS